MTVVDSSVWSIAYRRSGSSRSAAEERTFAAWRTLVEAERATLIGPIRQELLSGLREPSHFARLRWTIDDFELLAIDAHTFDLAASFSNRCRSAGIAVSAIDMTICAAAAEHGFPILTLDADFTRYATVLPIALA